MHDCPLHGGKLLAAKPAFAPHVGPLLLSHYRLEPLHHVGEFISFVLLKDKLKQIHQTASHCDVGIAHRLA